MDMSAKLGGSSALLTKEISVVTREELYKFVWSMPMLKVADQFGVSSSYMARVCTALNVPRPERGYWAKKAVGKAPPQEPLPDAQPGELSSWSRGGELPTPPKPLHTPRRRSHTTRVRISKDAVHPLISGAQEHFETGRPVEDGAYLKPYKKLLVDVTTSKANLDKGLNFANELFKRLEASGYRVVIAPPNERFSRRSIEEREVPEKRREGFGPSLWSPCRPTVAYIGTVPIGLAFVEMSERVLMRYIGNGKYIRESDYVPPVRARHATSYTWTTTSEIPSGRLKVVAYCPYRKVSWFQEWQESSKTPLDKTIPEIIRGIEHAAIELVAKLEEADRQAAIREREWQEAQERFRREDDRKKVEQSIKESRDELTQVIQRWAHVVSIEQFLRGVEERANGLSQNQRAQVLRRLNMVRGLLGTQDPLDFFMSWKTPAERYQPQYTTPYSMMEIPDI